MKKNWLIKVLVLTISSIVVVLGIEMESADAATGSTVSQEVLIYDFSAGGVQSNSYINSEGVLVCTTIEPVSGTSKLANGTYKVSHSVPGAWSASFNVAISSNKITSVSNASTTALQGSISNRNLKKDSSSQATLTFIRTVGLFSYNSGLRAQMRSGSLSAFPI